MSYDPNLPGDKDKVRLLIGDTDHTLEFLSDVEIEFFVTEEPTLRMAGSRAALAIAARLAKDTDYRFSTLWQDASEAYDHFVNLSEMLKTGLADDLTGIGFVSSISGADDCAMGEPMFRLGMHDDHAAWTTHDIDPCD